MLEVKALRKHPCPECGADAEWNPSKKALACPYCGTVLPWKDGLSPLGALIVEHGLELALKKIPDQARGKSAEQKSVRCESCKAISLFDATRTAQRCDFCGSPAIVSMNDLIGAILPESLLPVAITPSQIRDQLRGWYASRWWAPNKLKRAALTDTLQGIYLPYWTFDAHVDADWTAQSGYHYYETESYSDSQGKTLTRQVRKTRWENSSGNLAHFFDDDLVPGSVGVHRDLLRKVEPFPTLTDLKAYDPAYIRGWTVERYQIDLRQAAQTSESQMNETIRNLCEKDVPGDTYRNLEISSHFHGRSFKHILVPVWLVTYTYGTKNFQVVVNGYTGKMAGEHPLSWLKILFAIWAVLLAIGALYFFSQR